MEITKKRKLVILSVNLLIIMLIFISFYLSVKNLPVIDHDRINFSFWRGRNVDFRDGGFFVNSEIKDKGIKEDFLWGPYAPLKKGSYTVNIHYTSDEDQTCYAGDFAGGGESQYYMSSVDILSKYRNTAYYYFEITEDVEEFQFVIEYNGWGEFGVESISLSSNNNRAKRIFCESVAALLATDLLIYVLSFSAEKKRTVLALLGITCLVSFPLMIFGIPIGHDLEIHLLRIESIADALHSGVFPARISSLALWGLGYPFSIYYNDLFFYFPASLRLLGFSVNTAYKVYVFLINLLTVILAYYSFKRIFSSRKTGLFLTLLYVTASYRFINIFVRAAVGEYTAMAFLPLIALGLVRIYSDDLEISGFLFFNAFLLTAGLSGILGSHILSAVMLGFLIVIVALLFWRKTFRKNTIITFVLFALMTFAVNLYFLIPFMDYYFNVPTFIGGLVNGKPQPIQKTGAFPGQLFAFFQNIPGNADDIVEGRFQSTPGLVLMLVFVYAVYYRIFSGGGKKFRFYLFFSAFILLLSTDVFPWNWLMLHSTVWKMLSQIQFPFRFLTFAILCLTLLTGEIAANEKQIPVSMSKILSGLAVLMSVWCVSQLYNGGGTTYFFDTLSIDPERTGHEYLIVGTNWQEYDPVIRYENMETAEVVSRSHNRIKIYCKATENGEEHIVSAPVFNYKGYHVISNSGEEFEIETDKQNRIMFRLPDSYDGNIEIIFRDPVSWKAALWFSAGAVVFLVFIVIRKKQPETS